MFSAGWNAALRRALDMQGFQFRTVLHEGALADVYECFKGFKKVRLAVKAPGEGYINFREAAIVKEIAQCNLDKFNIVKCYGDIQMFSKEKLLVFEKLDMNLERYIADVQRHKPLSLSCIRDVAKQTNVALTALRGRSIIHADIKPSNIMIVKQSETPFTFKLIDFGSALWAREASRGFTPGSVGFMSPEVMLGLPFTPSTDVWSLGCVLAFMLLGHSLFDTESEFNTFKAIHELIGQPADELLDQGMHTSRFYYEMDGKWVLKSAERMEENMLSSLDDLKPLSVGVYTRHDPTEREQCVELLKKMLQVNPEDRITLEEIMKHPFITRRYPPKVLKWKPLIPFQRKKDISPQRPTNAPPSEKPKVFSVQRARNIFSNLKRNKIRPFSGEQTPCAKTKPEQKAQPRNKCPKTNSSTVSAKQKTNPMSAKDTEPSLPGIITVKPALQENRRSLSDWDLLQNKSTDREGNRPVYDDGGSQSQTPDQTGWENILNFSCYPFKCSKDAEVFRRVQRRFRFRYLFKKIQQYVASCQQKDPREALRHVNPREAELLDAASGNILRFKLAGEVFPPRVEYKIFTYRPIVDVCAHSPGTYTKPSNRQKTQQATTRKEQNETAKPHTRVEKNGWRLYNDFIKDREKTDTDLEIKEIIFRHSKLLRQRDKEREVKRIQIKWMKKMIVEDQFQERLKAMGIVDLKVDDLKRWFQKNPDDVEGWFLNEWIAWANDSSMRVPNYEDYSNSWHNSGYSLPSELTIAPNHRNYEPFGQ